MARATPTIRDTRLQVNEEGQAMTPNSLIVTCPAVETRALRPAALARRDDNARVVRGAESLPLCEAARRQEAAGSLRCVGVARAACRRAGGLCGSSRARAVGQNQPGVQLFYLIDLSKFPGTIILFSCLESQL